MRGMTTFDHLHITGNQYCLLGHNNALVITIAARIKVEVTLTSQARDSSGSSVCFNMVESMLHILNIWTGT